MKETGIIMSGSHPVDILEGRKTMTRRVIKPQPKIEIEGQLRTSQETINNAVSHFTNMVLRCPYGQVGDKLWARETHYRYGRWIKNGFTKTGKQKWTFKGVPELITLNTIRGEESLRYINNPPDNVKPNSYRKEAWYKRASLFMPRWASRINLEITGLRVERLQEITEEDAEAEGEGWSGAGDGENYDVYSAVENYAHLWDSLNAKRGYGWEKNSWVWVIEFKILQ